MTAGVGNALVAVQQRLAELLIDRPELEGESPRDLLSRVVVVSAMDYDAALTRAAISVLLVRAVERAETADFTSGDDG